MRTHNLPAHAISAVRRASVVAQFGAESVRDSACFRIVNADEAAKVYVYDIIGGWDLDGSEFVQAIHGLDAKAIDLHINSPGGFVFDAVAMYEALQAHPAKVTARIDGLAASAASFLSQAADPYDAGTDTGGVRIAKGGRVMIHDAQGVGIGSPADLREYAVLLDAVSDDIAGYYADRAGGKPAKWRDAMRAETWYSSAEAVKARLADRVTGTDSKTSESENVRSQAIRARARVTLRG
jgi:ATP-dependent protease ClpP protease subunit